MLLYVIIAVFAAVLLITRLKRAHAAYKIRKDLKENFYVICPVCGVQLCVSKQWILTNANKKTPTEIANMNLFCSEKYAGRGRGCGADAIGEYIRHPFVVACLQRAYDVKKMNKDAVEFAKALEAELKE